MNVQVLFHDNCFDGAASAALSLVLSIAWAATAHAAMLPKTMAALVTLTS